MYLHQRHLLISLSAGPGLAICYRPPAAVEIYIYASPRVHSSHTRWLLGSALGTTITNYTDNPCPPHQTLTKLLRLHQGQPGHPIILLFPCSRGRGEETTTWWWYTTEIYVRRVARCVYIHLRWICSDPSVYLYFIAQSMMMLSSIHLAVYILKVTTHPLYACMPT